MFIIDPYSGCSLHKRLTSFPHFSFLIHEEHHEFFPLQLKQQSILEPMDADDYIQLKFRG